MDNSPVSEQTEKLASLLLASRRLVVFTGAGVSTESGIPDFRSPGGLWERYDPDEFTIQSFVRSAETRKKMWRMMAAEFFTHVTPNAAHYALAELDRLGKLDCIITQNVDDLHQRAGVPRAKVYELHGNMLWAVCLNCGQRYPMEAIRERLKAGDEDLDCRAACHGILKPAGVLFGEALPERELREATEHSRGADLFLVIGSTLLVYPAAYMPQYAVEAGAKLAIINLTATPMDRQAVVVINAKAGEVMSRVVERIKAPDTSGRSLKAEVRQEGPIQTCRD
ncbi:MAG: NAD-dependent deacylase [Chloroflexi bacterium]|nr:NAD-dependent deacylase [Chloroflexota bacterium]